MSTKLITALSEQVICLQKGLILVNDAGEKNEALAYAFQANLMQWGYMLSQKAVNALSKASAEEIEETYETMVGYLRTLMGGKANFQPMYKNFPAEVMQMSDCQIWLNAMVHYWSNGTWMPTSVEKPRGVKFENVKYTILELTDMKGFFNIFTKLVSINQSLMPQDLEVVKWFVTSGYPLEFPKTIPFKENLCTLAGMGLKVPVWQTTDVLRIAVHMSGGDVMLPKVPPARIKQMTTGYRRRSVGMMINTDREKFKFRQFNRKERRHLLSLLERTTDGVESMVPKQERWFRLAEALHPGDHKRQFPKTYAMFQALWRGPRTIQKGAVKAVFPLHKGLAKKAKWKKVRTWGSFLHEALYTNLDLPKALVLLEQKPGEFMRRIDFLLRTFTNKSECAMILSSFKRAVVGSSNKVLYELYGHLAKRVSPVTGRSIMVKGARKRTPLPDLPAINKDAVEKAQVAILNALSASYAKLPTLGKVWVDPELMKIPMPTNMRSLNLTLKPIVRGTRTPFDNPKAKVVRAYCHWMDKDGDVDIDLSTTFISEKGMVGTLAWNTAGLKLGSSCHSGDVRNRRGACAEYIDVDIQDALNMGARYVVMSIHNFNGGPLSDLDATFGTEERQFPQHNLTWHPASNTGAQLLQSSGQNIILGILDLQTREYIYLDLDSDGVVWASGDIKTMLRAVQDYATPPKFSVYHLLVMHADARGEEVLTAREADTVFNYADFANSYELTGSYMGI